MSVKTNPTRNISTTSFPSLGNGVSETSLPQAESSNSSEKRMRARDSLTIGSSAGLTGIPSSLPSESKAEENDPAWTPSKARNSLKPKHKKRSSQKAESSRPKKNGQPSSHQQPAPQAPRGYKFYGVVPEPEGGDFIEITDDESSSGPTEKKVSAKPEPEFVVRNVLPKGLSFDAKKYPHHTGLEEDVSLELPEPDVILGERTVEKYLRAYAQQLVHDAAQRLNAATSCQARKLSNLFEEATAHALHIEEAYSDLTAKVRSEQLAQKDLSARQATTSDSNNRKPLKRTEPPFPLAESSTQAKAARMSLETRKPPIEQTIDLSDDEVEKPILPIASHRSSDREPAPRTTEAPLNNRIRIPQGTQLLPIPPTRTAAVKPTVANKTKHPAPLPEEPSPQGHIVAPPPPELDLSLEGKKVILTFHNNGAQEGDNESVEKFQIFTYTEGHKTQGDYWRKLGEVEALQLPMVVTLSLESKEGFKYHFAVRAVDDRKVIGKFCEPRSIDLRAKITLE